MLKQLLLALTFGVVVIGNTGAQEVIVARQKSAEVPKPTAKPSKPIPSETPTPASRTPKLREKKSAPATLSLEEMRAAGQRAAEGSNDRSLPQSPRRREPDVERAPTQNSPVVESVRPDKRETQAERRSSSGSSKSQSTNLEGIGPIRPTMIESGREPPSPSPSGR